MFDDEKGVRTRGRDGKPELRAIYNVGSVETCPPMCRTEKGCPKGTPENQKSHNPQNQLCYAHFLESRAVGLFPDDPVVRRNAAVIAEVTEQAERATENEWKSTLVQLVSMR